MIKIKSIYLSLLSIIILSGCNNTIDHISPVKSDLNLVASTGFELASSVKDLKQRINNLLDGEGIVDDIERAAGVWL